MKIPGFLFILAFPLLFPLPVFGQEQANWKKHVIVPASPATGNINGVIANDWDGDGHIDVMAAFAGKVHLIAGPDWKRNVIVHRFGPKDSQRRIGGACIHCCPMDVNGDGHVDFIGSNSTVFWLECPAEDPFSGAWTFRTVDDDILGTHCLITGDVDGDGKDDLIANSGRTQGTDFPNSLTWQKIPKQWKTAPNWERHIFADGDAPGGSHYTGFGDVNGDGRPDVSCAAKGGEKFPGGEWFAWWEQPAGGKLPWKKHLLADGQVGATNIIPHDLNADGVVDFAATRGHGHGVLWFRGPDFPLIEIDLEIASPHSLAIGDIDRDGDPDLATCGCLIDGTAAWYENDGKGGFKKHIIGEDQSSYDTRLVDMDGDGDLDVLIAGHFSRNIVWFENATQ
ncbi:MAG: VCBS repeat-containing protein [Verrucomicrobiales bacterium]|nr:VCBS repeat-containing protein [Verrucomicrobiales bacterium]